jgi:hypothetical protein
MNFSLSRSLAAPLMALIVLVTAEASAAGEASLPFLELTAPDGSVTVANRLPITGGKWLFIYLRPNHRLTTQLLGRMNENGYEGVPAHTVIVAGSIAASKLKELVARYPQLTAALLYADSSGKVASELNVAGPPIVLGLNNGKIAWTLSGFPSDPRAMRSLFAGWVGSEQIVK